MTARTAVAADWSDIRRGSYVFVGADAAVGFRNPGLSVAVVGAAVHCGEVGCAALVHPPPGGKNCGHVGVVV